ncbi:hypothetical protein [Anaeromyxobacter oryzae]|uniref:Uncharacterized protein n=1 Tax=Anaeromyxobacter oryzae TaxID=2918170 RepID=A0ABN6MTU9_9BACT|nr:hypothetical protein [Anaeromyxobacter oryzae]BDG03730.1 hypothetical protein AMOR_27260 [Anaeromyxobacter oryzae]
MARRGLLRLEWDAIAGVVAAVVAIVLELLHVAEPSVLAAVVVAILALILVRDLRREPREERLLEAVQRVESDVARVVSALVPPDALLIGPGHLRDESERFARQARGEVTYFNVCLLMFRPQSLFDKLLGPAIENESVAAIQFILDHGERENWAQHVAPKVASCRGGWKVREPHWCTLRESVSFILAGIGPEARTEALLSFWGEPFMSRTVELQVPRYIFRVQRHSELVARLSELERQYRMRRDPAAPG